MSRWISLAALALTISLSGVSHAADAAGMAKRARGFFEKLIEFKLEKELLVVTADPKGAMDRSSVYSAARTAFPNVSRLSVRVQSGSSSSWSGAKSATAAAVSSLIGCQ